MENIMTKRNLVADAREFAISAHWGDMYGSRPYYYHLDKVAELCKEIFLLTRNFYLFLERKKLQCLN